MGIPAGLGQGPRQPPGTGTPNYPRPRRNSPGPGSPLGPAVLARSGPIRAVPGDRALTWALPSRAVPCRTRAERSKPGRGRRGGTGQGGTGWAGPAPAPPGAPREPAPAHGARGCSGNTELGVPAGWPDTPGGTGTAGHGAREARGCDSGPPVGTRARGWHTASVARLQVCVAVGGSPWLGGGCQQHPWVRMGSCMSVPLGPSAAAPSPAATGTADTPTQGIEIATSLKLPRQHRVRCSLPAQQGSLGGCGRLSTRVPSWEKRAGLEEPQLCQGSCEGYFCCAHSVSHVPFLPGRPR